MKVLDTDLPGVKVIELEKSKDDRGYKETTLNAKEMKELFRQYGYTSSLFGSITTVRIFRKPDLF